MYRAQENRNAKPRLNCKYPLGRIMTEIGLKPFRPQLLQAVNDDDPDRRQQFCEEFLSLYHLDSKIVDEATFKLNGCINSVHNSGPTRTT